MSRTADVVVVGGGVVGASAAYHLAAAGAGVVVLLERADRLAAGSTGACAGGFRQQFSTEVNIRLSQASVPMITRFTEEHGLPLDVAQDGYLFLVRDEALWADFVAANALQRSLGVPAELLTPHDASELAPGVALDGVVGAAYGPEDGIADPSGLTQGYSTLARRAGAIIELGVEVTGVRTVEGRTVGVSTATGDFDAPVVIDAAGPWAGLLAETAGVTLPLEPIPRHVLVTGPFPHAPERKTLIIDAVTSFYLHREGSGVLMGMGNPDERPSFDLTPDDAFVAGALLPTALRVYPPLERAAIEHSWVGLYEMTPDRHPIVGASPVGGLYLATGFSGHGFQHAPVIGKVLSELVVEGMASTVDIAALSLDRFDRGQLVREGHVV
ncbi:MAG TPA: FAD-binding oxidoreductase [Actinomycetota bacterium]|nr:FAD-binding oxidoreductase [Actinomycetota bacterium]